MYYPQSGSLPIKAKSKGTTSRFTPPTRTATPTAPKATTLTTLDAGNTRECVNNASRCYKCSGLGHYARDCPNLKTLAFVPDDADPIYDTDVIPKVDEPAHILLGRPWKFNRKTKHDGFQNTYSFKKDGVNITLVPFDSLQTQAEGSNLFMKKTDFVGLRLLKEFADVIPDDIPPGLPTMRDIKHCIDFIPSFIILNRPAYRMNLKEFGELQRQVTELLKKGLIWESMSPCAVPAFSSLEQHLSHLRQIFSVLRAQKLYANGKKCHFLVTKVTFLGFHGLASFYRRDNSFGRDKSLALLCEQFYWPKMERDVNRLLKRCRTCHIAKTQSSNA
ncbi:reverse transcriptase domain-containing protein, partial [Tanacetum coccineum]